MPELCHESVKKISYFLSKHHMHFLVFTSFLLIMIIIINKYSAKYVVTVN